MRSALTIEKGVGMANQLRDLKFRAYELLLDLCEYHENMSRETDVWNSGEFLFTVDAAYDLYCKMHTEIYDCERRKVLLNSSHAVRHPGHHIHC